jgi:hypothetical protein
MSNNAAPSQEALFALPDQAVAAAPVEYGGAMMPLGGHWSEEDPRAVARAATLTETGGLSPERVRAATGVGEVAAEQTVADAGLQHRDWTVAGRDEHLAGAARTRTLLAEQFGLPPTRTARERNGQ